MLLYPLGGVNNSHSETVKCYRRVVQYHRTAKALPTLAFRPRVNAAENASVLLDTDPQLYAG